MDMQAVSDDAGVSESGAKSGVVNNAGDAVSSDNEMYVDLVI